MAIAIIDTYFAGNLGFENLAAVSLGVNSLYIFLLFLMGVSVAFGAQAAHAAGAGDMQQVLLYFREGAALCVVFGILFALVLLNISPIMLDIGQDPEVVFLSKKYLFWFAWTLPLQAIIFLFRSYFAVVGRPWANVSPVLTTLFLNAFLNYCLSEGNLGFPAMGIAGIGLASFVSNIYLVVMMIRGVGGSRAYYLINLFDPLLWRARSLLKFALVCLPVSLALLTEESFFSVSAFLAGSIGAAEQAAHQIVLNTVATSFLFNTGIATAVAILVGKHAGSGTFDQIWPTIKAGWLGTLLFTFPFAIILIVFGNSWANLFLDVSSDENMTPALLVTSVLFFGVAMLFIDSIWLIAVEALHGILDFVFPAVCIVITFWAFGFPLAYWSVLNSSRPFVSIWSIMLLATSALTLLVCIRLRYMLVNHYQLSGIPSDHIRRNMRKINKKRSRFL